MSSYLLGSIHSYCGREVGIKLCRIVGLIDFDRDHNSQRRKEVILSMRDAMAHGGPDDAGIYVDGERGVILGHRRLSILDLSPLGHQPMSNEDGNITITHNGEIYNFQGIKQDLVSRGYTFRSNTDTEVIIKAYEEWGEDAFSKLSGMFAFCLYDKRLNLIYLVRDHAGMKPLCYCASEGCLLFASEVKAFKIFNCGWDENKDWRIYFLIFGHIPEPFTTLKDVYMLPKGSFLRLDLNDKRCQIKAYVSLRFSTDIKDRDDAVKGVRDTFTKAVNRHLVSDAPLGVFLSGGIDSSLVAIAASRLRGGDLRTLSVVFNEKDYTEERYQDIVHNQIRSMHSVCVVTEKDFMDNLSDIFSAMDQPTIDGVNTYFISRCAKEEGLKAVLSGIGGDELFGGYSSFSRINRFWPIRDSRLKGLFRIFEYVNNDRLRKLSFLSIKDRLAYYLLFRGFFPINFVMDYLDVDRRGVEMALEKIHLGDKGEMGSRNFMSYLETDLYMKNQLLKDSDFFGMWHSVEIRIPFLDKELMQMVFSISEDVKFDTSQPKYLITKAFEDVLPEEIIHREKVGFSFPFKVWMKDNLQRLLDLVPHKDKKIVRETIYKFGNGSLHWSRFWALVVMGAKGI